MADNGLSPVASVESVVTGDVVGRDGSVSAPGERLLKRAVIYLRVSTSAQADTDYSEEGYSIPAQRDACVRKAEAMGARVVEQYVDRGESARSADRPGLLEMLARLKALRDVDYVIVHKVDRLARNRADDVEIVFAIRSAGAQLVSATENIDQTPSGVLLHGIMATIAEFYSQNLAAEVRKGMLQKVRLGGTPTRPPLGYLNTIDRIDGREIRSVGIDPERAPLVRWMFEAYLTGEFLLRELADALADKGLRTRPTRKRPGGSPVSVSNVERMLANPYYCGVVVFEGTEYQGRHEPLISREMFDQVQELKRSRSLSKEKPYQHPHHLKGSLFCGRCGIRMGVTQVTNRHGTTYSYFYCLGRQKKKADCQQSYVSMDTIEKRVADLWRAVQLPESVRDALRREVLSLVDRTQVEQAAEAERQTEILARLDGERDKLLQAHYAGAVPLDQLKREQKRITEQMAAADRALARLNAELGAVEHGLNQALELVANCHELYLSAPNHVKRQLNQAVFERIIVEDDGVPTARLTPAFGELLTLVDKTTTEARGRDGENLFGSRPEPDVQEWGPALYLRTAPASGWNERDIQRAISRVLAERENQPVAGIERKNPKVATRPQGSNVLLMAERKGFEPSKREIPLTRFPVALLRPLGHLSARDRSGPAELPVAVDRRPRAIFSGGEVAERSNAAVSKIVSGFWVRRGFKSPPLRSE